MIVSIIKGFIAVVVSTFLLSFVCGCISRPLKQNNLEDMDAFQEAGSPVTIEGTATIKSHSLNFVKGRRFLKTTKVFCEAIEGFVIGYRGILPLDLVDCLFPGRIQEKPELGAVGEKPELGRVEEKSKKDAILGKSEKGAVIGGSDKRVVIGSIDANREHILGSVYDYLYRPATEKPSYGLYSYVLLPIFSARSERFLEELFKTTSFVSLSEITVANLNIIYLPTREEKLTSLIPKIIDGSAPPVHLFAKLFYDYPFAKKLLAQICESPSKVVYDVCSSDLSRGPYLFTFVRPSSTLNPVPPPYLFVDLSSVHQRAFGEFVAAYKEQVKRSEYSDLERVKNLRLRILSIILTASDWISPVEGAIAEVVQISQ